MSAIGTEPPISPALPRASAAVQEPRIGVLEGDRPCARCCFNLLGQTIVRERHYGLLIVRCPECGMPAALQEYPALGRWASRLGFACAGVWLVILLALLVLSGALVWRTSELMMDRLATPYSAQLQKVWAEYLAEQQAAAVAAAAKAGQAATSVGYGQADAQKWWQRLDRVKIFRDAGGWAAGIAWNGLWLTVMALIILWPVGAALAVAAPHAKARGRISFIVLAGLLAGAFWWNQFVGMQRFGWYYSYNVWSAPGEIASVLLGISMTICLLCFGAGLWTGRAAARRLVVLLLPPRLRGAMAFLWISDGKPLPR